MKTGFRNSRPVGGGRGGRSGGGKFGGSGRGRSGGPPSRSSSRFGSDREGRSGGGMRERFSDDRDGKLFRKKVCRFSSGKIALPDFKDVELLKKYITEKGKIIPRRITGTSSKYQRLLAAIIKRSRHASLLPFQAD